LSHESEEENLSHKGKCQLSCAEYKQDHPKDARRKAKELLLQEIENLRAENLKLKSCLVKPKLNTTKRKNPQVQELSREVSLRQGRAIAFEEESDLCSNWLACGQSTSRCRKQGAKTRLITTVND
jgi:hypothetical protein